MNYYIGIMSGTSLDGIDAVLVADEQDSFQAVDFISLDFPDDLKQALEELLNNFTIHLQKLGEIETHLSYCYVDAVRQLLAQSGLEANQVYAIGCHGQTVFHHPQGDYPFTMQLVNGNIIAADTGIRTVVDFRRMDVAVAGSGAPLTPAFHQYYLNSASEKRAILNLGGIANLTILDTQGDDVIGFDNGPANCLMDLWIQKCLGLKYDKFGAWAASGTVNQDLLAVFLAEPYFSFEIPKSTGKELFNLSWILKNIKNYQSIKSCDVQATLCELTAKTIAKDLNCYGKEVKKLYLCGGGANNTHLKMRLSSYLPQLEVTTTMTLGVEPQWVESIAFAWLAKMRITNQTANLPSVTGANRKVLLGVLYQSC